MLANRKMDRLIGLHRKPHGIILYSFESKLTQFGFNFCFVHPHNRHYTRHLASARDIRLTAVGRDRHLTQVPDEVHDAVFGHLLFVGPLHANRERPMSTNWCATDENQKYTANEKTCKRDRRLDRSCYTVLHNELHVRSAAEFIIILRCDSKNNRARWAVESPGRKFPRQFHFNIELKKVPAPATFRPPTDGDTSH
jgi:hypothetical protein